MITPTAIGFDMGAIRELLRLTLDITISRSLPGRSTKPRAKNYLRKRRNPTI